MYSNRIIAERKQITLEFSCEEAPPPVEVDAVKSDLSPGICVQTNRAARYFSPALFVCPDTPQFVNF